MHACVHTFTIIPSITPSPFTRRLSARPECFSHGHSQQPSLIAQLCSFASQKIKQTNQTTKITNIQSNKTLAWSCLRFRRLAIAAPSVNVPVHINILLFVKIRIREDTIWCMRRGRRWFYCAMALPSGVLSGTRMLFARASYRILSASSCFFCSCAVRNRTAYAPASSY